MNKQSWQREERDPDWEVRDPQSPMTPKRERPWMELGLMFVGFLALVWFVFRFVKWVVGLFLTLPPSLFVFGAALGGYLLLARRRGVKREGRVR